MDELHSDIDDGLDSDFGRWLPFEPFDPNEVEIRPELLRRYNHNPPPSRVLALQQEVISEAEKFRLKIRRPLLLSAHRSSDAGGFTELPISPNAAARGDRVIIKFVCDFDPRDSKAYFSVSEFSLKVSHVSAAYSKDPPLMEDVYPREMFEKEPINVNLGLSPTLGFIPVQAGVSFAVVKVNPQIEVHAQNSEFGKWILTKTKSSPLIGDRVFHASVRKAKEQEVEVSCDLEGKLMTPIGSVWGRIARRKREEHIKAKSLTWRVGFPHL